MSFSVYQVNHGELLYISVVPVFIQCMWNATENFKCVNYYYFSFCWYVHISLIYKFNLFKLIFNVLLQIKRKGSCKAKAYQLII